MEIESDRIKIIALRQEMAEAIQKNSIDEDNRRFLPDEVFETVAEAQRAVKYLIACYDGPYGPFVYPVLIKGAKPGEGEINAGTIEVCKIDQGGRLASILLSPTHPAAMRQRLWPPFYPSLWKSCPRKGCMGLSAKRISPRKECLKSAVSK